MHRNRKKRVKSPRGGVGVNSNISGYGLHAGPPEKKQIAAEFVDTDRKGAYYGTEVPL